MISNKNKKNFGKVTTLIMGLVSVVLLGYVIWVLADRFISTSPADPYDNDQMSTKTIKPTGMLAVSGVEVGASSTWQIYAIAADGSEDTFTNISAQYDVFSNASVHVIDKTQPEHFFFKALWAPDQEADPATKLFEYTYGEVEIVPVNLGVVHGDYDYSPYTEQIAFTRYTGDATSSTTNLSDWEIVIANRGGDEIGLVADAWNPVWYEQGSSLLYLKTDGVYRYDTATNEEDTVLRFNYDNQFTVDTAAGFAVSNDERSLVLTLGNIYSYTLNESGVFEQVVRIPGTQAVHFNPVFDPTSTLYATIAVSRDNPVPAIEIRAIEGVDSLVTIPLTDFTPGQIGLDDWATHTPTS